MNNSSLSTASFYQKLAFSFLAALVLAIFAQLRIEIPWNEAEIPISGQSFAVLVIGFLMPRQWGLIAILIYLLLGIIGLPVYAGGASGIATFAKGSGGYLIGFIAAAGLMSRLSANGWGASFSKCLMAMAIGTIVILIFGLAWLAYLYGASKALEYGLYPFIPGAIIKAFLGALLVWWYLKD